MTEVAIIYNSKTGTTRKYAQEIARYLETKGLNTQVSSIQDYEEEVLDNADYVFFGCWTSGLMVALQKPEAVWVDFAAKLPSMPEAVVALFTTYKVLTGSMFRNMYKQLKGRFARPGLELKSRDGLLSEENKRALDHFID
jgi:flavodoxin